LPVGRFVLPFQFRRSLTNKYGVREMKKIVGVAIVLSFVFFPVLSLATDVGGIIDTDTNWDLAGSPYNLINDIQIAEGATLTINPGVIVNGSSQKIIPWGILEVLGTLDSNIFLNQVAIEQLSSLAVNAAVYLRYVRINGSGPGNIWCTLNISDSKLSNASSINLVTPSSDCYIERNIFNNSGGIRVHQHHHNIFIRNNVFFNQTGNYAIKNTNGSDIVTAEFNSFLSTDSVALTVDGSGDILAADNFWNTTDLNIIDSMIYDRNDDLGIITIINYLPFLTEPHPDTPPPPPNVICVSTATELQNALTTAASNGLDDVIQVLQGTYYGNFIYTSTEPYGVTIEGGFLPGCGSRLVDATNTVLDGGQGGAVLVLSSPDVAADFVVEGLTIQNGDVPSNDGGGLFVATGGGSISLNDTTIQSNSADGHGGGGVHIENTEIVSITYSTISNNSARHGAGVNIAGACRTINIVNNSFNDNTSSLVGGGINVGTANTKNINIINNTFSRNFAETGGGVRINVAYGNINLINNVVSNNSCSSQGGGLFISAYGTINLINNTINGNSSDSEGGGLSFHPRENTTITNIYNNLLWNNNAAFINDIKILNDYNNDYIPSTVNLFNNDFDQSSEGTYIQLPFTIDPSNLDNEDPLFVDSANGNYHLGEGSPCINTGYNDAPELPETDIDGQPRIMGGIVDMGAYEYTGPTAPNADFNGDQLAGLVPFTVAFADTSIGTITSWEWDFGDGSPVSIEQNPTHTYETFGNYSVSLTATGPLGSDTETKTDYISVNSNPVADAGEDRTVSAGENCDATVDLDGTGSHDPDGDEITYNWTGPFGTVSGSIPTVTLSLGIHTIALDVSDGRGGTSSDTVVITVEDNTLPLADVASLPDVTGECSATISSPPTATDNCAGAITATTSDPLEYTEQGAYTVTWTYDDGNGNVTTQTQNVIVHDASPPVSDLPELPTITGECSATIPTVPTATDNCGGTVNGSTSDPLTYTGQGTYLITWTYNDGRGNSSIQTQTVIVEDITAPVPDVDPLSTVMGACFAEITSAPTATDNCSGSIIGTTSDPRSYSQQGMHSVTWTFDDGNGNVTNQTQNVIVEENCPGLIAYYPLDGNAVDASGHGNHGILHEGVDFDEGISGQALDLHFDTSTEPVTVPDADILDTDYTFTLSVWVNPSNYRSDGTWNHHFIVDKSSSYTKGDYQLLIDADEPEPLVLFRVANGSETDWVYSQTPISKNQWTHIGAAFDNGLIKIFINGEKEAEKLSDIVMHTNLDECENDYIRIGGHVADPDNYNFEGYIDEVSIYNRALTESEVQDLYETFQLLPVIANRSHPEQYIEGESFEVCLNMIHDGSLSALGLEETVPDGWGFASIGGDDPPAVYPADDATGLLEFAWITPPESPIDFCYTVQVPEGEEGDKSLSGEVLYRIGTGAEQRATILPHPDFIPECSYHSGDYNPSDWSINLSELLRVIQFYNLGSYHCDPAGEDSYNPDSGDQSCTPHDSDYNPQDWGVDFSELLRTIQLYNVGSYHCDLTGEDGYTPGTALFSMMTTLCEETLTATHWAEDYVPGSDLTVSTEIEYGGTLSAVGVELSLPTDWSLVSVGGTDVPAILPLPGAKGTLEFAWITPPVSPIRFTCTVHVPGDACGVKPLTSRVKYRRLDGELIEPVQPDPLIFRGCLADFDIDGDVDGADIAALAVDQGAMDLSDFCVNFGRMDCFD